MRIGQVEINSKLALAPMAGVTDAAYRQICAELGAGLTYSELVSAKALCYQAISASSPSPTAPPLFTIPPVSTAKKSAA